MTYRARLLFCVRKFIFLSLLKDDFAAHVIGGGRGGGLSLHPLLAGVVPVDKFTLVLVLVPLELRCTFSFLASFNIFFVIFYNWDMICLGIDCLVFILLIFSGLHGSVVWCLALILEIFKALVGCGHNWNSLFARNYKDNH